MVLDTKSTKFKNSNVSKLIYVVLSLALCIGIAVNGVSIASFLSVFGESAFNYKQTIYDMDKFKSIFSNDVDTLVADINKYTYDKTVESKKDSICSTAFENYKKAKAFVKEHPNSDSGDYYADYEKYNIIETDEMELEYNEHFSIYGDAITVDFYIGFDISDSDAKAEIERTYKNDISYNIHYSKTENTLGKEEFTVLQYYAEDEYGNIVTNIDKKDVSKFKKGFNKNSAEYKSGNYTYFSNINNIIDGSTYLTDAYSTYGDFINLVDGASVYVRINNSFAGGDRYSELYGDYEKALPDYSFKNMMAFEAVMLVLLLILFVLSCSAAGHTSDGEVKTARIDKIPNFLHFILFAGCTFGLICLGVYLIDEHIEYLEFGDGHYRDVGFYPSGIVKIAMSALAAGLYLVFLEFFTSQCRQIKTHNNLFKNTLLYKFSVKLKLLLQYSPVNFKKRLLFLIIGYAVINVALAVGVFMFFGMEVFVLGLFFLLLMLALDAVCAVFAVRYIIQLDKIISAADSRKAPQVEFNKLPQSLKTLTLALSYTKQELDNAVQKAIRDERMKTELITNVSHDLKTPLTSIINYVDLLSKCDIEDQEAKEYISVLTDKSDRLKKLVDDLIEASKATSAAVKLNPVNLNLNELVTQAV
ncbi:MAG: sensor histidine kinase, partial [Eubacterium sp.]